MGSTVRSWLDKAYLLYFVIHIPVLFCVDLVPLYPHILWVPADAPLHKLYNLREWYIETYNDQFFQPPPAPIPSFFPFFAVLELVFHLPVSLWAVCALWKGLRGSGEVLLLVYGVETAITTATCIYEAMSWDPALVTIQQKVSLLGGLYGPYLVVAVILTADMWVRIVGRLDSTEGKRKVQ